MSVGAGDDGVVAARGRGEMRASHADREGVIATLKVAYVDGLVTKDEFDDRVGQTLVSRTHAELALITADIPAGLVAARPLLSPAPAMTLDDRAVGATAVLAALAFIVAFFVPSQVAALLALGAAGSALVSLLLAVGLVLRARRDKRSAGPLPPQGAVPTGRGTGQLPRISRPRRRSPADAARISSPRAQLAT